MLDKPLDQITWADLEALVENQVAESRHLEYKRDLPGDKERQKKDFLEDVCAMANSGGGDILYGIEDKRDIAVSLQGVETPLEDGPLKLRLQDILRSGIAPRFDFAIEALRPAAPGSQPIFLLRIFPSWNPPHMVTFNNSSRFYGRGGASKYQMDIHQIREAFLLSQQVEDRVRRFRDERLQMLRNGELWPQLRGTPMLVVHSVPLESVSRNQARPLLDLSTLRNAAELTMSNGPIEASWRPNLDGFLVPLWSEQGGRLLHRNGALELVDAWIAAADHNNPFNRSAPTAVDATRLGNTVLQTAQMFLKTHQHLGSSSPIFFMASLLNVSGIHLFNGREGARPWDREVGPLPELLLESVEIDHQCLEDLLKPLIEIISQAAGFLGSPIFRQ